MVGGVGELAGEPVDHLGVVAAVPAEGACSSRPVLAQRAIVLGETASRSATWEPVRKALRVMGFTSLGGCR